MPTSADAVVGSARIVPAAGSRVASGLVVFSYLRNGVTVSEAGVPAVKPGTNLNMFVQTYAPSGDIRSIQTVLAIANPASIPVSVSLLLKSYDGSVNAGPSIVTIPANGQVAAFLNKFSGFESLNFPAIFQGSLTLSTTAGTGIAVTGLRGRYNERGEFLITSLPTFTAALSSVERVIPHFIDGGGYSTQFIFPNMSTAGATLRFFTQMGQNMPLQLR